MQALVTAFATHHFKLEDFVFCKCGSRCAGEHEITRGKVNAYTYTSTHIVS